MWQDDYSSLTILDTIFNASEATIDGHLTLNQNIRVGAVPTTCTIFISDAPYTTIRR